jgi:hypothetical protein
MVACYRGGLMERSMIEFANRLCRLGAVVASVVLLSAGPSLGQSAAIPCSAFAHRTSSWKVLAPVVFDVEGRLLAPTVGTTFAAGSAINGIKLVEVLDRECGSR